MYIQCVWVYVCVCVWVCVNTVCMANQWPVKGSVCVYERKRERQIAERVQLLGIYWERFMTGLRLIPCD